VTRPEREVLMEESEAKDKRVGANSVEPRPRYKEMSSTGALLLLLLLLLLLPPPTAMAAEACPVGAQASLLSFGNSGNVNAGNLSKPTTLVSGCTYELFLPDRTEMYLVLRRPSLAHTLSVKWDYKFEYKPPIHVFSWNGQCCFGESLALHPTPYTLHPTPYTLHPTPYTLHPTPYTLHPTLYTLHPTPYTDPYTLHP